MAIPVSGADTWQTINNKPLSFQPETDNAQVEAEEYKPNQIRITSLAPDDLEIWVDDELMETERYGRWTWKPGGFAGIYILTVKAPESEPFKTYVRVLPSKLSFERYEAMLEDISTISEDLLFQLHSPAHERARARAREGLSSALREYSLIKELHPKLAKVMEHLRRSPRRVLIGQTESMLLNRVPHFSSEVQPVPGPAVAFPELGLATNIREFPLVWEVQEPRLTYDTYENRLLKHFLWRQLEPRIFSIQDKARAEIVRREQTRKTKLLQGWEDNETEKIDALQQVIAECEALKNQCIAWGSEPFLKNVHHLTLAQEPTQVLQKHPAYNRFYRIYLSFQRELGFDLFAERYIAQLAMRKLSELYETWSVFVMTNVALRLLEKAGYQIVSSNGFFKVNDDQFQVDVDRQANIEMVRHGRRVLIRYEPYYPPAVSLPFGLVSTADKPRTPDMSIELWEKGEAISVVIFDAKYKTESDGTQQTYVEDDLDKMSNYIHRVRWKHQDARQRPRQVVRSAYILYPGDVLRHDLDQPEIGALPLVPKMTQTMAVLKAVQGILDNADLL